MAGTDGIVIRFFDDGMWRIDADPNYSRLGEFDLPHAFLEVRCTQRNENEPPHLIAGGIEKLPSGVWMADVLEKHDLEHGSVYTSIGEYPTRNDALEALWAKRHELTLPRELNYAHDQVIGDAWAAAHEVAGNRPVVFASLHEGREFEGKVLSTNDIYTVQNLGRSVALHLTQALTLRPEVGQVMAFHYSEQGYGVGKEQTPAREISR